VTFEPELFLSSSRSGRHIVRADDQTGHNTAVPEAIWNQAIRAAVHLAHPPHANHRDADRPRHDSNSGSTGIMSCCVCINRLPSV
jgi:hypothetical protein